MRPLVKPLLIALALHVGAALILVAIRMPLPWRVTGLELSLMPPPAEQARPIPRRVRSQAVQAPPLVTVGPDHVLPQQADTVRTILPAPLTAADVLRGATDSLRAQAARRWALFHQPLPDSLLLPTPAELLMQRLARYGPPFGDPHAPPSGDRVGDEIYKRGTGHGRLTDVGSLLQKLTAKRAAPPPRITREPSLQELCVLKELWRAGSASGPQLYRQLDPALVPSAEWLDRVLEEMAERGLVRRRLVSPQDVLTVSTPLGTMEVERNQLNKLNRVYEYRPAISREAVLHYLQGALLEHSAGDSSGQAHKRLMEKLLILAREQ
ncbi:MAG: hypothetical protein ONB30_14045 [candidate division KSB1 bacterium]|nr:hypothetical protein [candidate division KSB1 bacterium]